MYRAPSMYLGSGVLCAGAYDFNEYTYAQSISKPKQSKLKSHQWGGHAFNLAL